MRDIPFFTTEFGVAALTLREIPYTGRAYCKLLDSRQPEKLTEECKCFCRAAGAEEVYMSGHGVLESYPVQAAVWALEQEISQIPRGTAELLPLQPEEGETWRQLYNEKMAAVPCAAYLLRQDVTGLLREGRAYWVCQAGAQIGLGILSDGRVDGIVSLVPGMGEAAMGALCAGLDTPNITLEAAEENLPAMGLYARLGFHKTTCLTRWYRVV